MNVPMDLDFSLEAGIYLVQSPHRLDLHNDFDFRGVEYSVASRRVRLEWQRGAGEWIAAGTPAAVGIEFRDVSRFQFQARDPGMPFTEDDCLASAGWWVDEEWCTGAMILDPGVAPEPDWSFAFEFQSGAIVTVAASTASAFVRMHADPA
jgi:hypothetical protein